MDPLPPVTPPEPSALTDAAPAGNQPPEATGPVVSPPPDAQPATETAEEVSPAHGAVRFAGTNQEAYFDAERRFWVSASTWKAEHPAEPEPEPEPEPESPAKDADAMRTITWPEYGEYFRVMLPDGREFLAMCDGSDRSSGIRVCLRQGALGINLNDAGSDLAGR